MYHVHRWRLQCHDASLLVTSEDQSGGISSWSFLTKDGCFALSWTIVEVYFVEVYFALTLTRVSIAKMRYYHRLSLFFIPRSHWHRIHNATQAKDFPKEHEGHNCLRARQWSVHASPSAAFKELYHKKVSGPSRLKLYIGMKYIDTLPFLLFVLHRMNMHVSTHKTTPTQMEKEFFTTPLLLTWCAIVISSDGGITYATPT